MAVDYLPQKLAPFDIQAVLRRTNGKPGLVRKMIMFPGSSWVLERPRYLAIFSLSQANDRVSSLYSDDMVGRGSCRQGRLGPVVAGTPGARRGVERRAPRNV
jgi:hypothetical protein